MGSIDDLPLWRPASWNEEDAADKPLWVERQRHGDTIALLTDIQRKLGYEALLSVDEQLEVLLALLRAVGADRHTLIAVTSDNGVGWGEHRLFAMKKGCAYEECQRVPLLVRYPRGIRTPGRRIAAPVLNIDVAPTLLALAGLEPPVVVDGRSFESWLLGSAPPDWRGDYLMEFWRSTRSDALRYAAQVGDGDRVRLLRGDPRVGAQRVTRFEFDAGDGVGAGNVPVPIGPDARASFEGLRTLAAAWAPELAISHLPQGAAVTVTDPSPERVGAYWFVESDAGGVMRIDAEPPDYFGVRDLAGGYTWVEHGTGERELYDLESDPHQLENRADDPAFAAERSRLEGRLRELLAPFAD